MNEDQNQTPNQIPPQPVGPIDPVPAPPPQPITPGYEARPLGPAPDPAKYRPPDHPISSAEFKTPFWVYIIIGVSFAGAIGLLVAVIVLM